MQTELEGTAQDTLRAAGICSGDTLWLMPDKGPAAAVTSSLDSAKEKATLAPAAHELMQLAAQAHVNTVPTQALALPKQDSRHNDCADSKRLHSHEVGSSNASRLVILVVSMTAYAASAG